MIKSVVEIDERMQACLDGINSRAQMAGADESNIVKFLFVDRALADIIESVGAKFEAGADQHLVSRLLSEDLDTIERLLSAVVRATEPPDEVVFPLGKRPIAKAAYPDASYMLARPQYNRLPQLTLKWMELHNTVSHLMAAGTDQRDALRRVVADMPREQALAFLTWYGIKTKSDANLKYLVAGDNMTEIKKTADYGAGEELGSDFAYHFFNSVPRTQTQDADAAPKTTIDAESAEEFRRMRDKMIGRTFAIDKLLERHHHLLTPQQIESLEDSLNTLRKNIRRLKTATLRDAITKTARIATKAGWLEGAAMISVVADDDATFTKTASAVGQTEQVSAVLESLQNMSSTLRQRAMIRELSARDIDLFNLGYGHISEVGDASAKLMEAFNSAANKIDEVIGRLRADLQRANEVNPAQITTVVDPHDLPLARALAPESAPADKQQGQLPAATAPRE